MFYMMKAGTEFTYDFLDHHLTYKQMYDEIQEKLNSKEDEIYEPA